MSDFVNALRDAASDPQKAKQSLSGLTAKWSEMSEEQRAQATASLESLVSKAEQMTSAQREQAGAMLGDMRQRMGTVPDEMRAQVDDLIRRFTN